MHFNKCLITYINVSYFTDICETKIIIAVHWLIRFSFWHWNPPLELFCLVLSSLAIEFAAHHINGKSPSNPNSPPPPPSWSEQDSNIALPASFQGAYRICKDYAKQIRQTIYKLIGITKQQGRDDQKDKRVTELESTINSYLQFTSEKYDIEPIVKVRKPL